MRRGKVVRSLLYHDRAVSDVRFADLDPNLKTGQRVCRGEQCALDHTPGTVLTVYADQLHVFKRGNLIHGVVLSPVVCIGLTEGRGSVKVVHAGRHDWRVTVHRSRDCT